MFTQDTSLAGQFVQRRKLRMRAQEASQKEIADGILRRLLARNKSFHCPDIAVGDTLSFCKSQSWKGSPRWRDQRRS